MEIFLNSAWAVVALAIVLLWFRFRNKAERAGCRHIVALLVLIAILFPVISVSDDLMAMQNATETDSCQRRDLFLASAAHPLMPVLAAPPSAAVAGVTFSYLGFAVPGAAAAPPADHPELAGIENRPPPAA